MEITRSQIQQKVADFSYSVAKRTVQVTASVALPALALYAFDQAPVADGGPVAHAACVLGCLGASVLTGPAVPAALAACISTCAALEFVPFLP